MKNQIKLFTSLLLSLTLTLVFVSKIELYAASVTPLFPGALNLFEEGDVIEEEDWNAIEIRIGENGTTTRSTLTFQVNDLMGSSTLPHITTLLGLTSTGALSTGSIATGFGTITTSNLATFGNLLSTGSSTLQNFTYVNATGTSATTTSFFATTASSTNLFSSRLTVDGSTLLVSGGKVGIASSTPYSALSVGSGSSITVGENRLATSTTMAIDWNAGNQQLIQKGTAGITLTFSNVIDGKKLVIIACNPGSSGGSITFPTSPVILWPGAVAPTQTTTANKCDLYSFVATKATSTSAIVIFGGFNQNY